jgi:hypothetical protein
MVCSVYRPAQIATRGLRIHLPPALQDDRLDESHALLLLPIAAQEGHTADVETSLRSFEPGAGSLANGGPAPVVSGWCSRSRSCLPPPSGCCSFGLRSGPSIVHRHRCDFTDSRQAPTDPSRIDRPPPHLRLTSGAPRAGSDRAGRDPSFHGIVFGVPLLRRADVRPLRPGHLSAAGTGPRSHRGFSFRPRGFAPPRRLPPHIGSEPVAARCRTWGSLGFVPAPPWPLERLREARESPQRNTLRRLSLVGSRTPSPGPLPSCRSSSVPALAGGRSTSLRTSGVCRWWVDGYCVGPDRDRGVAQHRTESSANRVARGISSPGPRIDPPSLAVRRTARTSAPGLPPLARRRVLALRSSVRDRSRTPGRGTSAPSRRCDLSALTAPRSPCLGSPGSGRGSVRVSLARTPVSRWLASDDRPVGRPLRGELGVSIAPAIGSACPPIAATGHARCHRAGRLQGLAPPTSPLRHLALPRDDARSFHGLLIPGVSLRTAGRTRRPIPSPPRRSRTEARHAARIRLSERESPPPANGRRRISWECSTSKSGGLWRVALERACPTN